LVEIPFLAANAIAFSSAWHVHVYFSGLSWRESTSSSTPIGNPLYPQDMMLFPEFTITAPTFVDLSLDFIETVSHKLKK
jgi:hypothetical protein